LLIVSTKSWGIIGRSSTKRRVEQKTPVYRALSIVPFLTKSPVWNSCSPPRATCSFFAIEALSPVKPSIAELMLPRIDSPMPWMFCQIRTWRWRICIRLTWPFANTPFRPCPASAPLVPLVVVAVVCVLVVGWLTPEGLVPVKLFADMMEMCEYECDSRYGVAVMRRVCGLLLLSLYSSFDRQMMSEVYHDVGVTCEIKVDCFAALTTQFISTSRSSTS